MEKSLIYGPVPSRRLGLSLGIDLVPYKICPFDCIYCQIGRTPRTTVERRAYVPAGEILKQFREKLSAGITADHITLGGSGEPTLNSEIGQVIDGIQQACDIPVAVLTNGATLGNSAVREALLAADVVLPSLDAPDASVFKFVNRPHPDVSFQSTVDGLVAFRKAYSGRIWLEIFFVPGGNTSETQLLGFKKLIERIAPDRVHLNTAVRPPAEAFAGPVPESELVEFAKILGEKAEVIAEFPKEHRRSTGREMIGEEVLGILSRRPCTINDIAAGLNLHPSEIIKYVAEMLREGHVRAFVTGGETYYRRTEEVEEITPG